MTEKQKLLEQKHGNLTDFWKALNEAADQGFITTQESLDAYYDYQREWNNNSKA